MEYDLASQFWRAGTSIAANVEEAQAAQIRAGFKSKVSIAAKEAPESNKWLSLYKIIKIPAFFSHAESCAIFAGVF